MFSLKRPLFTAIKEEFENDPGAIATEMWNATELLDNLGLYTTEAYLESRAGVIRRQQEEMLELSTPVVKLWGGIMALPLIGTLDSRPYPGGNGVAAREHRPDQFPGGHH